MSLVLKALCLSPFPQHLVVFSFTICILLVQIKYQVKFSPSQTSCWSIAVICLLGLITKRRLQESQLPTKDTSEKCKNFKSLVHVPACDTVTSSLKLKTKVLNKSQMMRFTNSGAFPVSNPRRLDQGKAVESWCLQSFPEAIQRDTVCQY